MDLHELLKLRSAELIHAPEERKAVLHADIGRLREAIRVEKQMQRAIVPTKDCGAAAAAEKETRAAGAEDTEQWKHDAEARLKVAENV